MLRAIPRHSIVFCCCLRSISMAAFFVAGGGRMLACVATVGDRNLHVHELSSFSFNISLPDGLNRNVYWYCD